MFPIKARRTFPVLTLTAILSLSPLASASAAADEAPEGTALLAELGAQVVAIWNALLGPRTDVGPRMDDNGNS